MLKKLVTSGLLISSLLASQVMAYAGEMLANNTFDNDVGYPWQVAETAPSKATFEVKDGKYYITVVNPGNAYQRWDLQFRHRGIKIQTGATYTVKFTVKADKNAEIYPKVGDCSDPYFEDWNYNNRSFQPIKLTANTPFTLSETFVGKHTNDTCELAFHIGGAGVPAGTTFVFDDIYLDGPASPTPPPPSPSPKGIRVNQLGYYPELSKKATLLSDSTTPEDWQLKDSSGKVVAEGKTQVFGLDKDSGDSVHIIDFSSCIAEGKDYKLAAGDKESYPFDIAADIYSDLKYDALKYYYHQRSGIPIDAKYVVPFNGTEVNPKWARRAGHNPDLVPSEAAAYQSPTWRYDHSHTLDVTGGWYDAGDHGKYVVNGGVAVWTLQNQFERAKANGDAASYEDGKMNIPESGNGYPDILDEARWHLECMMKMQIPQNMPLAGMVHHKASDEIWPGLGIAPHEDTKLRILKPPTTSATLDLATAAAQGSRLWKAYDPAFAEECLEKAEIAWEAAVANPSRFTPFDEAVGGCGIEAGYVKDEFYWAAAELYITTGKAKYLDFIKTSKHYLEMPVMLKGGEALGITGSFNWDNTQGMGTISLALNAPEGIDAAQAKANIKAAADKYLVIQKQQGYGITIEQGPIEISRDSTGNPVPGMERIGYPWGSNSFVTNSCIVMAYAYDFTRDKTYLNGAVEAMDYIMGRNPNVKSYVSGYGENPLQNPHHKYFAYQYDQNYPKVPPGFISGGPNSGLQDPVVRSLGWKPFEQPPQKSYFDHIESWSTNEVASDWNAPLSWAVGFLDDVFREEPPQEYRISATIKPDFSYADSAAADILSGFKVEVEGTDISTTTGPSGRFYFKDVPSGAVYKLKISKPNYLARQIVMKAVPEAMDYEPSVSIFAGDMMINGKQDNAINMVDVMEIAKVFNSTPADERYNKDCDLNRDAAINMADVMIVAKHFNATPESYDSK